MKLRRFLLLVLLAVVCSLLDTAVIPAFYDGPYFVPLTTLLILLTGMECGAIPGFLFGLVSGLLTDITCGTLGFMTLFYGLPGLLIGLLLYTKAYTDAPSSRRQRSRQIRGRAIGTFMLYLIGELVFIGIRYASSAVFAWQSLIGVAVRCVICTVSVVLLQPAMRRLTHPAGVVNTPDSAKEANKF